ncbi:hypothetical protein OPQ81_011765 [Rhizoctonia solani]|nr:hypothetical protein OPQ81_011765 [Rhizoctonia solani]
MARSQQTAIASPAPPCPRRPTDRAWVLFCPIDSMGWRELTRLMKTNHGPNNEPYIMACSIYSLSVCPGWLINLLRYLENSYNFGH